MRIPGKQHRTSPPSPPKLKKGKKGKKSEDLFHDIAMDQYGLKAFDGFVTMGMGEIVQTGEGPKLRLNDKGVQWTKRQDALRAKTETKGKWVDRGDRHKGPHD